MLAPGDTPLRAGVFITFSGNCRKALTFYQTCFGGTLFFHTLEIKLAGSMETPVVSGTLISESIMIHGSDLVPQEGRKTGNYLSVFLSFNQAAERRLIIEKLNPQCHTIRMQNEEGQKLVELTDAFDVSWILGI